ncbi:hypothetical protein CRYUN_Cryun21dG0119500 [Craigia yunnanensis]
MRNNEVQFAGEIQPRGCHYRLDVQSGDQKMFNRQVVKSESATIKIPELDFEIPPEAQRGSLSTVEGILVRAIDGLQALQEERKKVDPQTAEAIDQFLLKLKACATGECPSPSSWMTLQETALLRTQYFNVIRFAPSPDPSLSIKFYDRTPEQQALLGYHVYSSQLNKPAAGTSVEETSNYVDQIRRQPHGSVGAAAGQRAIAQSNSAEIAEALFRYTAPEEVMTFPSTCGSCSAGCETRMFVTRIRYFQEVIVMASTCDACSYRNSESDTASVRVPELDLELASGTLGGIVTTFEGLITKISESLERVHGFTFGDSLDESKKTKWLDFKARLNKILSMAEPWTLILDDALANSFIAPAIDDNKDDHQLIFEEYERSWEQNEELGLNDIDTSSADDAYNSTGATSKEKTEE